MQPRYLKISFVLAVLLAIISWVIRTEIFSFFFQERINTKSLLLIGVISSLENRVNRDVIRNTWGHLVQEGAANVTFLVGSKICRIHPADRISEYECERWNIHLANDTTNVTTFTTVSKASNFSRNLVTGFSFIVKHPVLISAICLYYDLVAKSNGRAIRVVLKDSRVGNKVASATFLHNGGANSGLLWKQIPALFLKSGFEGELVLLSKNLTGLQNCTLKFDETSGVIRFLELFRGESIVQFHSNVCPGVGFKFFMQDIITLRKFIKGETRRQHKWEAASRDLSVSLKKEVAKYKDIIFLNVTDVYRNLTQKVQLFLKWAVQINYWKFLLKTDDDVFIDIIRVRKDLNLMASKSWDWWSCVRLGWRAPRSGKWRDNFIGLYPPFPSGSGYILTRTAAEALAGIRNETLRGEDVTMGLNLALLNLRPFSGESCHWACDDKCNADPCNVPQLLPAEMLDVWKKYEKCQHICYCPR